MVLRGGFAALSNLDGWTVSDASNAIPGKQSCSRTYSVGVC